MNRPETNGPQIVLASSSPYRRDLLARLGLAANTLAPDIDESALSGETTQAYVQRLALAKAERVRSQGADAKLTIGSDQSAVLEDCRLIKPGSFERAVAQLKAASGRRVIFWTSVAVLSADRAFCQVDAVPTIVQFRTLSQSEIERYVATEQPFDCAGGFKAEGLGIALFEAIESSDPTALIGLPLIRLSQMLRAFGLEVP